MSEITLTQREADAMIKTNKILLKQQAEWPSVGGSVEVLLKSHHSQEDFILNYQRGRINLSKRNHHLRKKTIGLVRLDIGHPHRNPDGKEIGYKHLHLYREGYKNLSWAYDVTKKDFSNLDDVEQTIVDFLKYIHVVNIPNIQRGLV